MNRKRLERLRRRGGRQVSARRRKKMRLGHSSNGCQRLRAYRRSQVWSYDFVPDRPADDRRLKNLALIDEDKREALAVPFERSITARDVTGILIGVVAARGCPAFVRSDGGREFVARAVRAWLGTCSVKSAFIAPEIP